MNIKQAYYFPHFINARNDNKILKLRRVLGMEGYAIFFMLLEVLREQSNMQYPLSAISELEFDFRTSKEKISTVIHDYELFTVNEKNNFFSTRLIEYMQPYLERSERARLAANEKHRKWKLKNLPPSANADANANANNKSIKKKNKEKNKESETISLSPIFLKSNEEKEKYTSEFVQLFKAVQEGIQKNTPTLALFKEPLTIDQYYSLKSKNISREQFTKITNKMNNRSDILDKNVSFYQTFLNWKNTEY